MLSDTVRTLAFERALQAVIQPHHRVLDFGCGTGILAFFAHRAGAARIFAVDRSPLVQAARAVARDNGFDRIEFSYQEDVTLPSAVDVIVSEWMGHFVFNESMLEPLLEVRDRYLRPDGTMIPPAFVFRRIITDPGFPPDTILREPAIRDRLPALSPARLPTRTRTSNRAGVADHIRSAPWTC